MSNLLSVLCAGNVRRGFLLLSLLLGSGAYAQTTVLESVRFSESAAALTHQGGFALSGNPALFALDSHNVVTLAVVPSRLGVQEMRTVHAIGVVHSGQYAVALQIGSMPSTIYNELASCLHLSARLTDQFSAGIGAEYMRAAAQGFAPRSRIALNAGVAYTLSPSVRLGGGIRNITQSSLGADVLTVAQRGHIGVGIAAQSDLFFDIDLIAVTTRQSGLCVAVKYVPLDILSIRAALSGVPRSIEAGVLLEPYGGLSVQATAQYHDVLGVSSMIGVGLLW
ncbi:MAG: hypothetical protein JNL32_02005 [Candidatus Kapabacteria bacterium]|nr:hypothetical protein [Candidatus Kapabacteria bacterium]